MRLFVVSWRDAPVAVSLATAGERIGLETAVLTPPEASRRVQTGDLVLAYLDVRPTLDGVESGVAKLRGHALARSRRPQPLRRPCGPATTSS